MDSLEMSSALLPLHPISCECTHVPNDRSFKQCTCIATDVLRYNKFALHPNTLNLKAIPDRSLAADICRDQYHNVQNKIGRSLYSVAVFILWQYLQGHSKIRQLPGGKNRPDGSMPVASSQKLIESFPSIIRHLRDILQQVTDFSHCWPFCRIICSACPDQVNQFSWGFVWNDDFCDVQAHVGFPQGANLQDR